MFCCRGLENFSILSFKNPQQIKAFGTEVGNFSSKFAIILIGLLTFMTLWLYNVYVTGTQKWCKTAVTIALQNLAP